MEDAEKSTKEREQIELMYFDFLSQRVEQGKGMPARWECFAEGYAAAQGEKGAELLRRKFLGRYEAVVLETAKEATCLEDSTVNVVELIRAAAIDLPIAEYGKASARAAQALDGLVRKGFVSVESGIVRVL